MIPLKILPKIQFPSRTSNDLPFLMPKKLFVLAGEVSGDMHAAPAVARLVQEVPGLRVFGVGGEGLRRLGAELLYDTGQMSIMGFFDVLKHAGFLRRVIRDLKAAVRREMPDAVLLVDYPGMNLIMAKFCRELGIPVIYYISPQVWAWKEGRVKAIGASIDRLLVIFRFEVDFFRKHGIDAEFVGHPVIEELSEVQLPPKEAFLRAHGIGADAQLVGLLPGSRKQEVSHIFPGMLKGARLLVGNRRVVFLMGRAPNLDGVVYRELEEYRDLRIVECSAYEVMQYSDLGLVTSGTATLEALCFGMPMVVLYRTGWLNYMIGRMVVKLTSISLANIVAKGLGAKQQAVPELIQDAADGKGIFREASRILDDPALAAAMRAELLEARAGLASESPSRRVAEVIEEYLVGTGRRGALKIKE